MKKSLLLVLAVLLIAPVYVGCKSGAGSCFTRNGSRVPVAATSANDSAIASDSAAGTVVASPYNEVTMMQATSANSTCDPCAPNACDPCGPSRAAASSGYPASAYPGM